jgi:hypothetical protein
MNEHIPGVRSEEDRISTGRILLVGIASLVLFFIGSLASVMFYNSVRAERPGPPIPAELGSSKIAMVEQQLFDRSRRGSIDRAAREERLRSYGWVDRQKGVVHIPVDRAMELVAEGARPAPGGAPEPPRPPGGQP